MLLNTPGIHVRHFNSVLIKIKGIICCVEDAMCCDKDKKPLALALLSYGQIT